MHRLIGFEVFCMGFENFVQQAFVCFWKSHGNAGKNFSARSVFLSSFGLLALDFQVVILVQAGQF